MRNKLFCTIIVTLWILILNFNSVSALPSVDYPDGIISLDWSPDGTMIAGGGTDGLLRIWNANDGELLHDIQGLTESVTRVAWSPDSLKLASGSQGGLINIWDTSGTFINSFNAVEDITALAWSPDGSRIASSILSETPRLEIWDAITYSQTPIASLEIWLLDTIVWRPNNSEIAIANTSSGAYILPDSLNITITAFSDLDPYRVGNLEPVSALDWHPNGNILAIGTYSGNISAWNTSQSTPTQLFNITQAHPGAISWLSWSPDGGSLGSSALDGIVRIWNGANGQSIGSLQNPAISQIRSFAWSPDSQRIVYGGASSPAVIQISTVPMACTSTQPH